MTNTITYPLPNTKETRAGAKAFLQAMVEAEKAADPDIKSIPTDEWYGRWDKSAQILLDAAGENLSPHTIGVILLFAEILNRSWILKYEIPDPEEYIPEVSLTKRRIEKERNEFSEDVEKQREEDRKLEASYG